MTLTSSPLLVLAGGLLPTLTNNSANQADCVLIRDGKLLSFERWQDIKLELPSNTQIKDISGTSVLPGLGDAHVHFAATGFLATALDCKGIKTVKELLERIAQIARQKAPGELILGLRLEHLDFPSRRLPSLSEFEAVAPNNPVYLRHITGHASVASRSALKIINFDPNQAGVQLDENGEPTGSLIAQSTQIATQRMYALNAEQMGYEKAFRAAAQKAVQEGCTVVHALDDLGAVTELMPLEPTLPIRVMPYTQSFDIDAVQALGLPRIGGCHGCALDGDFDVHTAALSQQYLDKPESNGILYHDHEPLLTFVFEAHKRGLQCAFHAVGDRAVEQALSVYEYAQKHHPRTNARHRIEHAQLIAPDHIARVKRAGIVMGLQPAFNFQWHHQTYEKWVGELSNTVDPVASFHHQDVPIAGGSDSTVTDMKPLLGIHSVVNHSREIERLAVNHAIDIFSYGIAYSTHHEHHRGRLEPGFDADLTLLQSNPFETDPTALKDIEIAMTVCRGTIVYEA